MVSDSKIISIINTGEGTAAQNMLLDGQLLDSLDSTEEIIIHLYQWKTDSLTYGHFIDPSKFLDLAAVERRGLDLAKRPTGGGMIFHLWDYAFSVLVPATHSAFSLNTLDNYKFINQAVIGAIQRLRTHSEEIKLLPQEPVPLDAASAHFCMAKATRYDVMINGKKVGGAAQRRTKKGYLHQGTISLQAPDPEYLQDVLLPNTAVLQAMQLNTHALLGQDATVDELAQAKKDLAFFLEDELCQ